MAGRRLDHWHGDAMSRRTVVLDEIEPRPGAKPNPGDLPAPTIAPGALITVRSCRGEVTLAARADCGTPEGAVFIALAYHEADAILLTNPAIDTAPNPPSRLEHCNALARAIRGRSGTIRFSGSTVTRSLPPLPWRMTSSQRANSTTSTRSRSPSSTHIPVPYSSAASRWIVPFNSFSSARTAASVSTTGSRRRSLATTISSSQGRSMPSTWRYRNSGADFGCDGSTPRPADRPPARTGTRRPRRTPAHADAAGRENG